MSSREVIGSSDFPLGCELELTYRCNQQCPYCFNDSGLPREGEIGISQWIRLSEEFSKNGAFECVLQGGEPLILGEDLYRIMDVYHDHDVRMLLVTNGSLIDEHAIDRLAKYEYSRFQIAVGGPTASVHEHDRGAPHSFEKVIRACVLATQIGLPLTISFTVTKHNVQYIEDMVQLSYMVGADRILVNFLVPAGRGHTNAAELCISKEQKAHARELTSQLRQKAEGKIIVTMMMDVAQYLNLCLDQNPSTLLIRPNGDAKLDWLLPFKLGNVRSESVIDLWNRIGRRAWSHPAVSSYIKSLECEDDLLHARPRPHVDADILLM